MWKSLIYPQFQKKTVPWPARKTGPRDAGSKVLPSKASPWWPIQSVSGGLSPLSKCIKFLVAVVFLGGGTPCDAQCFLLAECSGIPPCKYSGAAGDQTCISLEKQVSFLPTVLSLRPLSKCLNQEFSFTQVINDDLIIQCYEFPDERNDAS